MPPNIKFIAIVPKQPVVKANMPKLISAMRRGGNAMVSKLSDYPSPISDRYVRTGDYGRLWSKRGPLRQGRDLVLTVTNNVKDPAGRSYVGFVAGKEQADVHKGRWATIEDVGDTEFAKVEPDIVAALRGK